MEAVFRPEIVRWISVNFLCFPAGSGWESSDKIRKLSGRILLEDNDDQTSQQFHCKLLEIVLLLL
jgi:hypothetical protein